VKKIVLGLAGEIAAGKSTVANYLKEKHQAENCRFSTALRDVARRMCLEESRENLQKISTLFRENFDDNLLSKVIAQDVKRSKASLVVIDGVRRLADIAYLKRLKGFCLIYIEASIEKRYARIIRRKENSDDKQKTFKQFQVDHQREAERQVKELKKEAIFILDNNGDKRALFGQVEKMLLSLKNKVCENFN